MLLIRTRKAKSNKREGKKAKEGYGQRNNSQLTVSTVSSGMRMRVSCLYMKKSRYQ